MDLNKNFESLSIKETINYFDSDEINGLSNEKAKERLVQFGENKFEEKKKDSFFKIFFNELKDPMIFVLLGAVLLTLAVSIYDTIEYMKVNDKFNFLEAGDWADIIIILAVIVLNGLIGTIQEMKANNALDALKKMSSPEANVIRNGQIVRIKSKDLVVGDIVVLEEGDTIGADMRLIQSANLKVDESSLTGESTQVEKDAEKTFDKAMAVGDRTNMVYMSTPVTNGRGKGLVVRTGMSTEIGKIAKELTTQEDESTPLQKVLAKLSKTLGFLTLAIVVLVFLVEVFWIIIEGNGSNLEEYLEAILSSISLAVAAIPEGLAAVVAIVLSIGVQRMVKANTIVRKLPSVETLGSVKIVCSDKTGTLTQNKMTVVEAYVPDTLYLGKEFLDNKNALTLLAKGMSLCSNAEVDNGIYGDPTEIALVNFANLYDYHKGAMEEENPRVNELPFDSVRKMMSTLHKDGTIYTKGAVDSILKYADRILVNGEVRPITKEDIAKIYEKNTYFSGKALRVLALAYHDTTSDKVAEENLIFVGLVAMVDPPREESKASVAELKKAGITTVMITGDHKDTAFAIAKELGICSDASECYTGHDVDLMSEEELKKVCLTARVFARVSPQNKVSIVRAFKANGNICAMTGDGVNDAPSLKSADIGIAMGITGTDVAKNAADMVLTDDNFASIEKAVEEGRSIYKNIKKTIYFLLSSNIAEVFTMLLLIIVGLPLPLIAIHLLWINLITDSLPAIALGMDPKPKDIMNEKPRDPNEGIFSNGGFRKILVYGLTITVAVIFAYLSLAFTHNCFSIKEIKELYTGDVLKEAQTRAFVTLALSELIHMIGISSNDKHFTDVFGHKNLMMVLAFVVGLVLQLVVVEIGPISSFFKTTPLSAIAWLICTLCSLLPLVVHEVIIMYDNLSKR